MSVNPIQEKTDHFLVLHALLNIHIIYLMTQSKKN